MRVVNNVSKYFLYISIIIIVGIVIIDFFISYRSNDYIYDNFEKLPKNKVGLVLGTSKYYSKGILNEFYKDRILTAYRLYKNDKVDYLLVSGDNSHISYNEPITMRNDLIKLGVPDSVIYLDYAGFRTLDAIIRAQRVFGQDKFTIISQNFHNQRALFIARKNNIHAIAYNAAAASFPNHLRVRIREVFARTKVFLDIYVLNTQPKFLGKKIDIK